ncbi:hypothetical protein GCM10023320_51380 [Pseudonocardia adelaidensis]|uniref:Uncharacterized protein n=1 Tax=Pseudonocardia adelaidensis TaxID=648754 RepID=A0ABP9NQF6_9PSEU
MSLRLPVAVLGSILGPATIGLTRREHDVQFGKLVDKAWEDKSAAEILKAPPSALEGLSERHDEALKEIGIKTVGDLGKWKYASRAAALVALAELDK